MAEDTPVIVGIHQPNFLPWLGYFHKYLVADVFVLLDDAQLQKTGGCIVNRVKMLAGGEPKWVTVAVDRSYHGVRQIRQVMLAPTEWAAAALLVIRTNYRHAGFFNEVYPLIERCLQVNGENLAEFNERNFRWIVDALALPKRVIVRASSLNVDATGTARLVRLVGKAGGTTYVFGAGAACYQDAPMFAASGIELLPLNFKHPEYVQSGASNFKPGLSIVDCLMNCGFDGTRRLLEETLALSGLRADPPSSAARGDRACS